MASIPIDANPRTYAFSKSSNTLYVLHDTRKSTHFLSAVNLTTQRVDKEIKVGAGEAVQLLLSNDGRRLFCYTASCALSVGADYYRVGSLKPPCEPVINVIDTASNEEIATYEWFKSFRAAVPKGRFFSSQLLGASDGGHLIVASKVANWIDKKPVGERFEIFSLQSPHATVEFDPGGQVVGSMFSKDEKFL